MLLVLRVTLHNLCVLLQRGDQMVANVVFSALWSRKAWEASSHTCTVGHLWESARFNFNVTLLNKI